jgi:hypothetical protein
MDRVEVIARLRGSSGGGSGAKPICSRLPLLQTMSPKTCDTKTSDFQVQPSCRGF